MNEQEFRELSAARALHALSADEEQGFSSALAQHPEWHRIVRDDQDTAAALAEASDEIEPPASARASILDLVSRSPQFEATDEANRTAEAEAVTETADREPAPVTLRRRFAGWFALAASVAVLLTGALVFPWNNLSSPVDPVIAALQQIDAEGDAEIASADIADGTSAAVHWSTGAKQAVFVAEGMQSAPEDRDYELWIVRGDRPISLGVVPVTRKGSVAMLAPGFKPGDAVAITVESKGGSPTGTPTTEPIMVIATA